jgi:hypothetical protein
MERHLPEGKQFRKYIFHKNINSWKVISLLFFILALFGWLGFFAILFFGEK